MSKLSALVEIISGKSILMRQDLMRRYGKSGRSIDRWHRNGTLPAARYLRGCPHPFWRPCDIEAAETHNKILIRAKGKTHGKN